jgi:hypothetical protein
MQLFARLDESTLRSILDELLPVTLLLDEGDKKDARDPKDGRWVRIEPTSVVDFIAGEGLRLVTSGQIRWITAGMPIEATLHSAEIMLRPRIAAAANGGKLVFGPSLEAVDVKNVPAFLDRGVVALVNRQLAARGEELAWDFGRSLGFTVAVSPMLEGVSALTLAAHGGKVRVTADAIELGIEVRLDFLRRAAQAGADTV